MSRYWVILGLLALSGSGQHVCAQTTYTGSDAADAFVATGSPDNPEGADLTGLNFGGAGILVVAPAGSVKGEFQSLLRFDLAGAVDLFNSTYGMNQWTVTALSLTLTSNYGTAGVQPNNSIFPEITGGNFVIEWLADEDWAEGTGMPNLPTTDGITYAGLPDLLAGPTAILSTNTYVPPGNNVPVTYALPLNPDLVNNVSAGGEVTLLFYAADGQIGYLFNSDNYGRGNEPVISVTARQLLTAPVLLSGGFIGGQFHLTAQGEANQAYQVQAASDLDGTNWETVGNVTAGSTGLIQFDDPATNLTCRYYRLFQPGP